MTKQELAEGMKRRKLGDTQRAVIVVQKHKTGLSNLLRIGHTMLTSPHLFLIGQKESALLVADAATVRMALLWLKVQDFIWPDCTLAFPDFQGKLVSHLERKMLMAARTLDHNLPNPSIFRKELEIRNKRQDGPLSQAVSRVLSHSLTTAQQFYQAPTLSDTYATYEVMQEIITGTRASSLRATAVIQEEVPREDKEEKEREQKRRETDEEEKEGELEMDTMTDEEKQGAKGKRKCSDQQNETSPPKKSTTSPRKRRGFSKKDEDLVADFFAQNIAERKFPTADECHDFIKLYPQFKERKPKDIYDKCRNLAGR